jgi:hypothetical protein
MKKLDDIPKNHPFEVPDGYFDQLPGKIMSRIEGKKVRESNPYVRFSLQYALPAMVLVVAALFYFKPKATVSPENMLASISTEELVLYLEQTDITTDELLDEIEFDKESVEAIENEVYGTLDLSDEVLDALLYDLQLDSGNNL